MINKNYFLGVLVMAIGCGSSLCTSQSTQSLYPAVGATYEHYSGKRYKIIAIAHHSEDLQKYVVYQGLYNDPEFGNNPVWIRPATMFMETIEKNGQIIPRFKQLD
jgi:hypothetical protein